jgi:hypothetical protein
MAERLAIFIDYQNVHLVAHGLFQPPGVPVHASVIHPVRLAELITSKRKIGSELAYVRVFRGRPNPAHHPVPTAAFDAQKSAWERDTRCQVVARATSTTAGGRRSHRAKRRRRRIGDLAGRERATERVRRGGRLQWRHRPLARDRDGFSKNRTSHRDRGMVRRETVVVPRDIGSEPASVPALLPLPERRRLPCSAGHDGLPRWALYRFVTTINRGPERFPLLVGEIGNRGLFKRRHRLRSTKQLLARQLERGLDLDWLRRLGRRDHLPVRRQSTTLLRQDHPD